MRIISVTHYAALLGANRSLLHLLEGLRREHATEILVFCPREGAFTAALAERGIPCEVIPFANWTYGLFSLKLWLFPWLWFRHKKIVLPKLIERAASFRPDLIHSNSSAVSAGMEIAGALDKPHIWHVREFGWADYRLVFPLGRRYFFKKMSESQCVIFISEAIKKAFEKKIHAPGRVVYNGIGPLEYLKKLQAPAGDNQTTFRFLIIGLLHPAKGQLDAIKAFVRVHRAFPAARLVIAGTGRRLYTLRLKWAVLRHGLRDVVEFTGYVERPGDCYARADAVLMCSKNEAMGRVTAEAMVWGKPVIGYAGGATPEIIRHEETGYLYRNIDELVERMKSVFGRHEENKALGASAREFALRTFADEPYAASVYGIMSEALKGYSPAP